MCDDLVAIDCCSKKRQYRSTTTTDYRFESKNHSLIIRGIIVTKQKKKFKAICVCVCDTIKKFDPKTTTTTLFIFKNIVQSICVIARQWHKSIENMTSNIIHYWSNHCSFKFIALFWNFFAYFEFDHSIRISVDWFLILLVSIWTNLMIVFNSSKIKWQLDDRIFLLKVIYTSKITIFCHQKKRWWLMPTIWQNLHIWKLPLNFKDDDGDNLK